MAVKVLEVAQLRGISDIDAVRNELAVMQTLRHEHIIAMHDALFEDGAIYVVLECASGGDLRGYLLAHVRSFAACLCLKVGDVGPVSTALLANQLALSGPFSSL